MSVATASPFRFSHTVGLYQMAGRGFSHPVDLAIGRQGELIVVNRGNPGQAELCVRVSVTTLDEQDLGQFCNYGVGDGQLTWATAVAVDSQGRIYIADEHRQDIQVFGEDRQFLSKWGAYGCEVGQLDRPSGLAFDADDTLLVVDHLNHRVQRFTADGKVVDCWGSHGSGSGEFHRPWGLTIDAQGDVYVADWGNDRVQKLTREGRHLASYGSKGRGEGELWRPSGVAVDGDGLVYVADRGNDRVQVYTPGGSHFATLYGDAELSGWAKIWLDGNSDVVERRSLASPEDFEHEKRFWAPTAVKIAPDGSLLVLDTGRHRMQVYRRND
jgi:DNA-binding beta-propeller fold protein YncE